ncbi:LysR family transcriptional regulator [Sodalis endosymbiont of Spalangia cameroni]|uniref:LysR family transcriptional regulator n=1 Tax=Sodalis praecaptivus TaxID=1239307 RepID=UPI0031F8573F
MTEPDLNLLIALDALLAEASVAGAARRLGLSASAMSRTLSRLRAVTGDPLLVRAGRRLVPTPYAEEIRPRTRQVLDKAHAILRPPAAELQLATLARTFILSTNEGFVEALGAPLIAAAAAAAPQVRLCFAPKPDKTAGMLRQRRVDLEIGVVGDTGPEMRLQALFYDRFVGLVRQGHPLARATSVTAAEYAACGHVVASRRGQRDGPVDAALFELGLQRNIVAVVPSFPAALAVALASDLVALVPASFIGHHPMVQNHGAPPLLCAFELPVKTPGITVSQMWHPRFEVDPAHRWLRQLILAVCRQRMPE